MKTRADVAVRRTYARHHDNDETRFENNEDIIRGWDNLPQFSKDMYKERYFVKDETYEDWAREIAKKYADNKEHEDRLYVYLYNNWFHPSTPISSKRGYPISCFTNSIDDNKESIFGTWHENNWLGAFGGGVGTDWEDVREMGHAIKDGGRSSGKIPMLKVSDASTLAVSQGGLRRASQAVYTSVQDPEIIDFIDLRRPTGDINRRSTNLHHGIKISDKFMEAMLRNESWDLISPKDGKVKSTIPAYDLFKKILISRMETGEPYIMFTDNVLARLPKEYLDNKRSVIVSNLCTEIFLHTDKDNTGVCCLVSVNARYYEEWKDNELFIEDIHRFTDNVLSEFIAKATSVKGFEKAVNSATLERSIGIGVMGYHDLLQSKMLPYDSLSSKYLTRALFKNIKEKLIISNAKLGKEKGTCKISKVNRNTHLMAVAPTASISTLCGLSSQGIDPRLANIYTAKTNIGSYTIKNKFLEEALDKINMNTEEIWKSILDNKGSILHLDISNEIKDVFLTGYEIDNRHIVDNVSIMQEYVCQGISTNLFLPADAHIEYVMRVHIEAWKKGLKSLYYVRSNALNKATISNLDRECLSCQ